MSIAAINAVLDATVHLSHSEKLVLVVLAQHADDDGGNCWPAQTTIARKASHSLRGVQKVLDQLERRQLARVVEPALGTRSARYQLALDRLASSEPGSPLSPEPGSPLHISSHEPRSPLEIPRHEPGSPLEGCGNSDTGERHDTLDTNPATSRHEPRSPDQSDQSFNSPKPLAAPVRSRSSEEGHRTGPPPDADDDGQAPFRVHVEIARKAIHTAFAVHRTDDLATITEIFKSVCAAEEQPYVDLDRPRAAIDAAMVSLKKARQAFVSVAKRHPVLAGKYAGITAGDDDDQNKAAAEQ